MSIRRYSLGAGSRATGGQAVTRRLSSTQSCGARRDSILLDAAVQQVPMRPHAVAVSPDVDDVVAVQEAVDERRGRMR